MMMRPNTQRSATTLRPLTAELSPLAHPDGSASLHVGNTHVLCAVHGPVAPRSMRHERYAHGVVSVVFSRGLMSSSAPGSGFTSSTIINNSNHSSNNASGNDTTALPLTSSSTNCTDRNTTTTTTTTSSPSTTNIIKSLPLPHPPGLGATERELEHFIRDALSSCILLERYPRCVIQVVLQIVQADGSVLGSAVNCAVLALMDAGVAMKGLPIASTCVVIDDPPPPPPPRDDETATTTTTSTVVVWLDPTMEEESGDGHATVVLVTDMSNNTMLSKEADTSINMGTCDDEDVDDFDDNTSSGEIITLTTFGAPLSIRGLLSSAECAKHSSSAMVAFMRMAIEQKAEKESRTLWS